MVKLVVTLFIIAPILLPGCLDTNSNSGTKIINPNGDSELALLMRDMFDDGLRVKKEMLTGKLPEIKTDYHGIHTAIPTEEGKNASLEYQLFAKAYEASVERFKTAEGNEKPQAYQTMVETCMNCHQEVCPGPMVRIKKLYLSDADLNSLEM